ncbi:vWA domain-containing protein [Paraclostridium bifermentans]|nr:vWA domain-containing protein [Paraclostridium bifermentans]
MLVIDSSGSMNDKIDKVQDAAKNLSKNILNGSNDDQVRISVADFSYNNNSNQYYKPGASSKVQTNFTSNLNKINKAIDKIDSGGGTNTQDGIWRTQNLLEDSRDEANKYVVFFQMDYHGTLETIGEIQDLIYMLKTHKESTIITLQDMELLQKSLLEELDIIQIKIFQLQRPYM